MHTLYPCLWFNGQAEEAAAFDASLLPNSHVDRVWCSPAETPSGPAGMVLTVDFTLLGNRLQGLNGGPDSRFNEAVSFVVEVPVVLARSPGRPVRAVGALTLVSYNRSAMASHARAGLLRGPDLAAHQQQRMVR